MKVTVQKSCLLDSRAPHTVNTIYKRNWKGFHYSSSNTRVLSMALGVLTTVNAFDVSAGCTSQIMLSGPEISKTAANRGLHVQLVLLSYVKFCCKDFEVTRESETTHSAVADAGCQTHRAKVDHVEDVVLVPHQGSLRATVRDQQADTKRQVVMQRCMCMETLKFCPRGQRKHPVVQTRAPTGYHCLK